MRQPIDDKQQLANVKSVLRRLQNYTLQPEPDGDAGPASPVNAAAIPPAPPIDAAAQQTHIQFNRAAGAAALAAVAFSASQKRPSKRSWVIVAASLALLAGGAWLGTNPPAGTVNTVAKPASPEAARAIALTTPPAIEVANSGSAAAAPVARSLDIQGPQLATLNAAPFAPAFRSTQAAPSRQSRPAPPKRQKKTFIAARRDHPPEPVRKVVAHVKKAPSATIAGLSSKTPPGVAIAPPPAIAPTPAIAPLPLRR